MNDKLNIEVSLEQVWAWDCPVCGMQDQVIRGIIAELNEDEKHELAVKHGVFGAQTGDWLTTPKVVECSACGREFPVTNLEIDDD